MTGGGISSVILGSVMSIMWHNDVNDVNMFYILGIRHPVSSKLMGYKVPHPPNMTFLQVDILASKTMQK